MSSFLLFHEGTPLEIQYTPLIAKGEERYVIKAAEVGAVIRLNKTNTFEVVGNAKLDTDLLQEIGVAILKIEKNWCMTLYDYNALNEPEKIEAISNHAVLLGERKDAAYRYALYQIDGFYIELKYDLANNIRQGIRSFATTTLLEPYLGSINIGSL